MAITTYEELQAAALNWMAHPELTSAVVDWIVLAEARLNSLIGPVEQDTTLTGTVDSVTLSTSALSLVEPVTLWLSETGEDEEELQRQSIGTLPFATTSGEPSMWAFDTNAAAIKLDRPCDSAYTFRFRYRGKLALATTSPNWLLTNRPDIYLAATIMWGAGYNEDVQKAAVWKAILDEGIREVRHTLAQARRGILRVDPGLLRSGTVFTADTNG